MACCTDRSIGHDGGSHGVGQRARTGPGAILYTLEGPLKGDGQGSFYFHPCSDAGSNELCLHDDVTGTLTQLGITRGSFEVIFDIPAFDANGCGPIRKQGSFFAANGDRLDIEAQGTFCFSTLVATYEFRITGGTGRFTGASGGGSWLVPPPATFDGVAGIGDEFFSGVVVKLK